MTEQKDWSVMLAWTLSKGEIDNVAQKLGVNTNKFSAGDYDEIARKFMKGLGWSNELWEDLLEEAVNLHTVEKSQRVIMR
jgi:hypothetical protein